MPIKPENAARYPADWPQIRARIQQRAGNKCEQCGVDNYALGGRTPDGAFHRAHAKEERMLRLVWPEPGEKWWCGKDERHWLRIIRIVCTTAHLDHVPENCSEDNLRFWCQRCHLSYDAEHHAQTAYATRREGLAVADLFESVPHPTGEPMPSEWSIRTRERLAHVEIFPMAVLRLLPAAEEFDSGIYFLWRGEEMLYVGKSRNLCGRAYYQHTVNRYYPFQQSTTAKYIPADLMTCLIVHSGIECPPRLEGRLQELERAYIAAYEPPYNVDYRNGFT